MKLPPSPFRSLRSAALIAGGLAVLVFSNSIANEFAYDDLHIVVENTSIHSLSTLPGAIMSSYWPDERGEDQGLWRPTTTGLLGLQYALWGDNGHLYHVVNVLAHGVTTALVVLLLAELLTLPVAFASGVIFAIHPVHTEAVANVIGMAEIVSTLFFLLACLIHVRGGPRSTWRVVLPMAVLYALAFGAKEIAVTLPGAIFLIDAARTQLGFRELPAYLRDRWKMYVALAATAGVMLLLRFDILGSIANPLGPLGTQLLDQGVPRIWTLGEIWSHYVRLMVLPMDLSADYSPSVIKIGMGWHALNTAGAVMALAILAGSWVSWRRGPLEAGVDRSRVVAFGALWFLITISPVSNVLFLAGVLLAERTLYLPSVGAIAAMAWLLVRLFERRRRVAIVVMIVMGSFMTWRTWTRSPVWKDNPTVFGSMLEDYPHSGRSQWILGDFFLQIDRKSEALTAYRAAIGILGNHYNLVTQISRKLIAIEENEAAERLLIHAYEEHPDFSLAQSLLAVIYSEWGDAVRTERFAREAVAIASESPVNSHLLAWALTEQGRYDEAVEARLAAMALGEGDYWQQWVSLAHLEVMRGDTAAARVALDSAAVKAVSEGGSEQVNALYLSMFGVPPESDTLSESGANNNEVRPR